MNKEVKRLLPILSNGIKSIISPLTSIIFSFLIVRFFSKQLWGEFVDVLLLMLIITLVSSWGNKEILLRLFSKKPNKIIFNWQNIFLSRLPILAICIFYIIVIYNANFYIWLILWAVSSYIFLSFNVVLNYNRDYNKAILFEIISFALLLGLLLIFRDKMNLTVLVQIYTAYNLLKAILFSIFYNRFFKFKTFSIKPSLLLSSSVFFLLGFSGFLQSKIDVYVLQIYNNFLLLGEYQIISSFFIFSQTIASILLYPYVKNVYRMLSTSIITIKHKMAVVGLFLNSLVVLIIYLILNNLFTIQLNVYQIIFGFFIGYPSYIYTIHVFNLFKNKREKEVLKICILCALINLTLSLLLLRLNLGITGLLFANAASQITSLFLYIQFKIK